VIPFNDVVGYQYFGGYYCLHIGARLKVSRGSKVAAQAQDLPCDMLLNYLYYSNPPIDEKI
jgi:hypothetical protein